MSRIVGPTGQPIEFHDLPAAVERIEKVLRECRPHERLRILETVAVMFGEDAQAEEFRRARKRLGPEPKEPDPDDTKDAGGSEPQGGDR